VAGHISEERNQGEMGALELKEDGMLSPECPEWWFSSAAMLITGNLPLNPVRESPRNPTFP
jgi:hypothetical protein